jgi:glycerophosphoryl diester phosphodiesterase
VEFVAHRGESADAPENTLAAFKLAWERKVPAIELDIHLTKDGRLIVSHDNDTARTTGIRKSIKDTTLEELRTLDAGKWKGEKWLGEKLPTLEEVLATIPDKSRCFIEIKIGPEAVPALVEAVRTSGKKPEQMPVISFNADSIAETKRKLPKHKAYFLSGFKKDATTGEFSPTIDELIAKAKEIKADGLDLAWAGPLDATSAKKIKDEGLELYVWTVDKLDVAKRMIDAGVDGVTTNRAAALAAEVNAK